MKNLFKALADFQQEVPVIHKGSNGYGYTYADLSQIFKVINPLLKKHGLGFFQLVDMNTIKTTVFHHESGEKIESSTYVPFDSLVYEEITKFDKQGREFKATIIRGFDGMNKAQAIGSLITYFRRYSLSAILGLVTDKDTDAATPKEEPKEIKKPELTAATFKKMIEAINQGQGDKVKAAMANYSMTEQQKVSLETALKNV